MPTQKRCYQNFFSILKINLQSLVTADVLFKRIWFFKHESVLGFFVQTGIDFALWTEGFSLTLRINTVAKLGKLYTNNEQPTMVLLIPH